MEKYKGKETKEVCELEYVETWSDKGWTTLKRVIRHNLASHKKMFRIVTKTGFVDVTDDHSLLLENGKEISPRDIKIGTKLMHNDVYKAIDPLTRIFSEFNFSNPLPDTINITNYFKYSQERVSFKVGNNHVNIFTVILAHF